MYIRQHCAPSIHHSLNVDICQMHPLHCFSCLPACRRLLAMQTLCIIAPPALHRLNVPRHSLFLHVSRISSVNHCTSLCDQSCRHAAVHCSGRFVCRTRQLSQRQLAGTLPRSKHVTWFRVSFFVFPLSSTNRPCSWSPAQGRADGCAEQRRQSGLRPHFPGVALSWLLPRRH